MGRTHDHRCASFLQNVIPVESKFFPRASYALLHYHGLSRGHMAAGASRHSKERGNHD